MMPTWLSLLPPLITIAMAIWSRQILPSLLVGLLVGCYLLHPTATGGLETAVDQILRTLLDEGNLQVLLFLYLFSGLVELAGRAGGIKAFSNFAEKHIKSERGVFFVLWALIPVTFIDCGFRVVAAGSITRGLAEKHKIARARLAFMLNNTSSPVVELIPIATTFVGFNLVIIAQGLKGAGLSQDTAAYAIWLRAIPFEFFSIVLLAFTLLSVFFQFGKAAPGQGDRDATTAEGKKAMDMSPAETVIAPRVINLVVPMLSVIVLTFFFFWFFGKDRPGNDSVLSAMAHTEPNKAMLTSLFIALLISGVLYLLQKYSLEAMTSDVVSGGNKIMPTLAILILAWPLAAVAGDLGLNGFVQQQLGRSLPGWSVPVSLFVVSSTVTYFIGSGWGAASLLMPVAIPLAASAQVGIPLCVAAVITGGTFGDVTSPVAGMTNMASNVARADHAAYLRYARPYNLTAAGVAAVLFLVAGFLGW
ncbi:MAG: hypothetical protein JJE39_03010 [Vicinamibacteria bacterium]|nr:hypothetical protein [Vicinamibacteria bacterium]